jgi:cellulose synthase/poly-beta-1,6-N-acetylglucosamine synthase-like glycosyltransferase
MKFLEVLVFGMYGLCLAFIFCYSLVQLQLTLLYLWAKRKARQRPTPLLVPAEWPRVTVQLPVYNERYVVERLIDAIMALDYPADKLEVQVLDDSTDDTRSLVAARVARYQAAGKNICQLTRPHRQGFKAGALQHALPLATGDFIAVFDADFLPLPDFLQQTIPAFTAPRIGVVQTRWGHLNQNYSLLTRLQAFGLNAHFTIEQVARNAGGHFINFNGTAGVWRKSCILDAGSWQPDTLTEDLDLSYRAQIRHWQFKYLEQVEAPAELPASMPAIKSQQFRWTKGAAETTRKNLLPVLFSRHPLLTKVNAVFHLLNSTVFVGVLLAGLLSIPILFLKMSYPFSARIFTISFSYAISLIALLTFYWVSFRERNHPVGWAGLRFLPQFFLFLSITMGFSLHNSIAVMEGYLGIKTPFIRTPKFNIRQNQDSWENSSYAIQKLPLSTWLEGVLCFYFLGGIFLGFFLQDYVMVPFHIMLSLGFGLVCFYSVKHSR